MGTAPTWREEKAVVGAGDVERGRVKTQRDGAAISCESCAKAERAATGVTGARLSAGREQQTGVAQLLRSLLQQ